MSLKSKSILDNTSNVELVLEKSKQLISELSE